MQIVEGPTAWEAKLTLTHDACRVEWQSSLL